MGRFASPDTIVPEPTNLQDWNRYSYVRNNPLNYIDPTGHLTEEEIEEFFGVDNKDDFVELLGEAVAEQLWGTEFTWGDVLDYDGGSAMLVLFEQGEGTGYFEGGFYGIGGERSATRISSGLLRDSETAGLNSALTQKYKDLGYENLPKRWIDHESRYNHVTTRYVDVGIINNTVAGTGIVAGGWEALATVNAAPKPPQAVAVTAGITGLLGAGAAVSDAYFGTTILRNFHQDYPVIRPSRAAGYLKSTWHINPPVGIYE